VLGSVLICLLRMKLAFIAAIVLAFAVHLTPRCEAKEKTTEITTRANEQEPRAVTAVLALAIDANQQGPASSNDATQNQTPSGYKPSEWALPLIGIITAGFICWQSWETRKAAQASQKSVKAAERNADILIASERAWMSIKADMKDYNPVYNRHRFYWQIKNTGKSVAVLISTDARCVVWNGYDTLPETPEFGDTEIKLNGRILAPNEPYQSHGYFEDWKNGTYSIHDINVPLEPGPNTLYLLVFGRIKIPDSRSGLRIELC
jgi:hypothetical protein